MTEKEKFRDYMMSGHGRAFFMIGGHEEECCFDCDPDIRELVMNYHRE